MTTKQLIGWCLAGAFVGTAGCAKSLPTTPGTPTAANSASTSQGAAAYRVQDDDPPADDAAQATPQAAMDAAKQMVADDPPAADPPAADPPKAKRHKKRDGWIVGYWRSKGKFCIHKGKMRRHRRMDNPDPPGDPSDDDD